MNCHKTQQLFDDRLDQRLDAAAQAEFDAHVADCRVCHEQWQAYADTWQLLGQYPSIQPSFGFVERALRRLDETRVRQDHPAWLPVFRWLAFGLTVVAVGMASWLGWQQWSQKEPSHTVAQTVEEPMFAQINHGSLFEDLEVIVYLNELP